MVLAHDRSCVRIAGIDLDGADAAFLYFGARAGAALYPTFDRQLLREAEMTLKIERFQPEGMNVRMSGGQPSYSHVVTVSGTAKIV